jgi:hypothetical protein
MKTFFDVVKVLLIVAVLTFIAIDIHQASEYRLGPPQESR